MFYLRFITISFVLLNVCFSLHADDQQYDLTVIASKVSDQIDDLPNHVTVITADDLASYPNLTLPEILSLKAGLQIRSSFGNNAARSVIDIRGFGATGTQNTLILLDGKRLNDIDQSTINYAALPIDNIERIEIIRGAGGVLYGDGAVGGVINIITKRTPANTQTASITQRYASYNTWQTDIVTRYGTDKLAVNLFLNRLTSDGYRNNNDLDQENLQGDIRYIMNGVELFTKFAYSNQELGLPGNRTVDPGIGLYELQMDRLGTNNPDDRADEEAYSFTLGGRGKINNTSEYILDAGYRQKQQISNIPSQPRYIDTSVETFFITPRFNSYFQTGGIAHSMVYGLDLYHYQYESSIANSRIDQNTPVHELDIRQNSYAVYVNDLLRFNNTTTLTLGGRYQLVEIDATDVFNPLAPGAAFDAKAPGIDRSDNEYFFNIGLNHQVNDFAEAYISWGQSVRMANVDDINQVSFPPPAFVAIREFTDLRPQRSRHLDFGLHFENTMGFFDISYYHIDLNNEIHFNPASFLNENLDKTTKQGIEINAELVLTEKFTTGFHYNITHSEFEDGPFAGNDVPLVAKNTFGIHTVYRLTPDTEFVGSWRYIGERFFDNDQTNAFGQKIPAYSMLDISLNQRFNNVNVSLGVNNLFDEKAYDTGVSSTFTPGRYNALPLPERNYAMQLQINL